MARLMPTTAAQVRTADATLAPGLRRPRAGLARWLGPDYRLGILFVLPIIVLVLALVAYPFGYAVYLSLTRKYVGLPPVFVGLENYVRLTFDGFFQRAVANSFLFTFSSVAIKLVLGMGMALVLTAPIRFRSFWTGVLLIPWVAPTVVSALNFLWIYDYSLGVLNYLLVRVFRVLPQGVGWLSEPGTAMASVIGVNVWRGFPFFGISFLAGMKAIPGELYEAAAVDGASALQRFRHVTLPGLKSIVIIVVLLSTIWTFNDFAIIYILTKGGPGGATQVIPVFTYEMAFGAQRLGEAIAVALYLLPALAFVIIVLSSYMRRGRAR
jgi:ABC-type sugar transport system permease subunit